MVLTGKDILTSRLYGVELLVGEQTQLMVGFSSRPFRIGKTINEQRILVQSETADGEILYATQGLDSIQCINRQFTFTQQVMLYTIFIRSLHIYQKF